MKVELELFNRPVPTRARVKEISEVADASDAFAITGCHGLIVPYKSGAAIDHVGLKESEL